jgi:S-adenosylmethionine:tRNA ribosyltransferase-isomerase
MKVSDFDYCLPPQLIAQQPLEPRDISRLMIVDREKSRIEDIMFKDIPDFFNEGDCLVINNTRVFPARLKGFKAKTKGKVEVLLLSEIEENKWEVLVKPARRLSEGMEIVFGDASLTGYIEKCLPEGERIISFKCEGDFKETLRKVGEIPLPPYIHQPLTDVERYQTIYAEKEGSVAAPTAGLHFTESLLKKIEQKGVIFATITLQVGIDTFRPVKTENVEEHKIHKEYFELDKRAAEIINRAIESGGKIVAAGTTSVRALEAAAVAGCRKSAGRYSENGKWLVEAKNGWTDLFIYPGYRFKIVDTLLTNFHLPKSTLLMLVSAFAGGDLIMEAYRQAIKKGYRFFSFGDAMLIV